MPTRHVLLGLLDIMPMSGYDVRRNLGTSLGSIWAASYGQIYPTLHKLAREGLIETQVKSVGDRERIVYSITGAGRDEFRSWLLTPVRYQPYRDPFRFWASYLDVLPLDIARQGVRRHIAMQEERRDYCISTAAAITSGEHPMIRARAGKLEAEALERLKVTRAMIFAELAAQAEFEIGSAKRLLKFREELAGPEESSAVEP